MSSAMDPLPAIQIHPADNVAVALGPLAAGQEIALGNGPIRLEEDIPQGHKVALAPLSPGQPVIKYGHPIGRATQTIGPGRWVHTHNLATGLDQDAPYRYRPSFADLPPLAPETFPGFVREEGGVGVRNEVWILPTVGCVNDIAQRLAADCASLAKAKGLDGVYAFPHPYGCSQMGADHQSTRQILAGLARHPNGGGVLVVGLGCENNTMEEFRQAVRPQPPGRIRFLVCQEEADELETGRRYLAELIDYAARFKRQPVPVSKLVVGLKCGGSDGLSGITANPVVGAFSDRLIARGGGAILTEVPEMFGAEDLLMNRAVSQKVFDQAADMIGGFKEYFRAHGQVVYENPSPGNKEGGITTLEDKSLGCVQKGGSAPVSDVIGYGEQVRQGGLTLLSGPGNDLVSTTALTAAGAQLILFTTGRGTPFGAPAPTLKISSNTALARRKPGWIDFDAGTVAGGAPIPDAAEELFRLVVRTAGGQPTRTEAMGCRGIAIFKNGVTL